ncbi:inovirus-type Gp2 protein [Pseudoalteromonas sp. Angola-7]|uniref:YagK/YfjJ domain-containing protein n=1 Tax=Pseudoalteromonas sp. Angola-7 TaxID=3025336 RepID=UPI002358651F|nr:inovirus-type Gp2 protein [Pseudoalteromonas sp. Angola-7]MDC9531836.1 inovirus-type Gp2 protein [Pseudoalteromonas sp. Angola-7]
MTFKISTTNSVNFIYKDHSYRVFKPKTKGQDLKALTKVFRHCECMLSHYSKVLVARIDLSTKSYSINNQAFLKFIKKQLSILTKQYNCKVSYICARERNTSSNHHYHLAVLLSGHKINHSSKLTYQLKHAWESEGLGSASLVKHPYYLMHRGNKFSIEPALYRLSYFTKRATKEASIKAHSYLFSKLEYSTEHVDKRFNDMLLVNSAITYQQNKEAALINLDNSEAGGIKLLKRLSAISSTQLIQSKLHRSLQYSDHLNQVNNAEVPLQHSKNRSIHMQSDRSPYVHRQHKALLSVRFTRH